MLAERNTHSSFRALGKELQAIFRNTTNGKCSAANIECSGSGKSAYERAYLNDIVVLTLW